MPVNRSSFEKLAGAVRKVYDATKQIRAVNSNPKDSSGAAQLPEKSSITAGPLNEIFGAQGESKDGMVKFTFGRPATMHGVKIDNTMGVNTWVAFAGSDDNAVVDGDFAVTEDELQPTARSLLKEKINIVAIHQHMTHEQPRIMFFHYWGRGHAKDLARQSKARFWLRVCKKLQHRSTIEDNIQLEGNLQRRVALLLCSGDKQRPIRAAQPQTNDSIAWRRRTDRSLRC